MNTLEMIKDWQDSGCKKKYLLKNGYTDLPSTAYNNGVGVLFFSCFVITVKDPILESRAFTISEKSLKHEWEEIVEEYDIHGAIRKAEAGDTMISLVSSNLMRLDRCFTKAEIEGNWIEIYKGGK